MFYLAKFFEAIGMGLLLVGLIIGMSQGDTWRELSFLGAGGVLFLIGYGLERKRGD